MKTKNYLGKRDENRGIILFGIIFVALVIIVLGITIVQDLKDKNNGVANEHVLYSKVKKAVYTVDKYEMKDNALVLEGKINDTISESMITRLKGVDFVLTDSDGDKYEFPADYFISSKDIEVSSIIDDKDPTTKEDKSSIVLDNIHKGEYYILVRVKYSSKDSEEDRIDYYTIKNSTETEELQYNEDTKVFFEVTDGEKKFSYLNLKVK